MQPYTKTNWVNDETLLSANNMNKIENQLETLTTNAINEAEDMGDLTKIYFYRDQTSSMTSITNLNKKGATWFQKIIDDYFNGNNVAILLSDYNDDEFLCPLSIYGNDHDTLRSRAIYEYGNLYYRITLTIKFNATTHIYSRATISWSTATRLATETYVDDSITNAIGNINTVLATLTTPTNNGGGV